MEQPPSWGEMFRRGFHLKRSNEPHREGTEQGENAAQSNEEEIREGEIIDEWLDSPEIELTRRQKIKEAREKVKSDLEILRQFGNKEYCDDFEPETDPTIKKDHIKELFVQIKYNVQGYDADRANAYANAGKPQILRINKYWHFHSVQQTYHNAWRNLRLWAQENGVWDEKDQREWQKEMGGESHHGRDMYETARNVGLNIALGGLYGVGYALMAPWKAFELLCKQILPYFMEDKEVSRKMLEAIFGKAKEKKAPKEPTKKKEDTKEREYKNKIKLKEYNRELLEAFKNQINQKINSELAILRTSEEYQNAAPEARLEQEDDIKEKHQRQYRKEWRGMRVYWIQEQLWTVGDEKKFRDEMGIENLTFGDLLSPREFRKLDSAEKRIAKIEQEFEKKAQKENWGGARKAQEKELYKKDELRILHGTLRDINEEMEKRRTDPRLLWPAYQRGGETSDFVIREATREEEEEEEQS